MYNEKIKSSFDYNIHLNGLLKPFVSELECFGPRLILYRKFCRDLKMFYLVTDDNWANYVYDHGMYGWQMTPSFIGKLNSMQTEKTVCNLWPKISLKQDKIHELLIEHGMWHGATTVKKTDSIVEMFTFCAQLDQPNVSQFYLRNQKTLEQFILFF